MGYGMGLTTIQTQKCKGQGTKMTYIRPNIHINNQINITIFNCITLDSVSLALLARQSSLLYFFNQQKLWSDLTIITVTAGHIFPSKKNPLIIWSITQFKMATMVQSSLTMATLAIIARYLPSPSIFALGIGIVVIIIHIQMHVT